MPTDGHFPWLTAAEHATCRQLLQASLAALQAGDSHQALANAERAARESARSGCAHCQYAAAVQRGLVHVHRSEYDHAILAFDESQAYASDGALIVGMALSQQLCRVLKNGTHTARRLEQLRAELGQQLSELDMALQTAIDRLTQQQTGTLEQDLAATVLQCAPRALPAQAASPIDFDVRCLGIFAVFHNGRQLSFARNRKVEGVLKYMVVHRDRPVSRDTLMRLGWPDATARAAANDLNTTVSVLRGQLSNGLERQLAGSPILFADGHYRLHPDLRLRIDIKEFDTCCDRGLNNERHGLEREAINDYAAAVDLYGGDLLMGDLYDDWTIIERERLASVFLTLLSKFGNYYMRQQRYEEAIAYGHRLLEHDPCREDAHCLLMHCFARLGQRVQALRQFDLCRRLLQRELQIDPAPETAALRQRIACGDNV